ncbi:TonB-dependent receptor [Sesbania bispinosa]|nr:TonB-dependent receptor [Sesbania bispinosa]
MELEPGTTQQDRGHISGNLHKGSMQMQHRYSKKTRLYTKVEAPIQPLSKRSQ